MIYQITIALVVIGCLVLAYVLRRRRHGHEPLNLISTALTALALLLAVGLSIQGFMDQQEGQLEASRRDQLIERLVEVVAEIQRDQSRPDLDRVTRQQRLAALYRRYNAIRGELARATGRPVPAQIEPPGQAQADVQSSLETADSRGRPAPLEGAPRRPGDEVGSQAQRPASADAAPADLSDADEESNAVVVPAVAAPPPATVLPPPLLPPPPAGR